VSVLAQHDDLVAQRRSHPAWRLLAAEHAPLVLGFLDRAFLAPNVRALPGPDLVEVLDDHLYALRAADSAAFPKTPEAYVADWADPARGWLRRWYPAGSDVPHYAPTAAVEIAAAFVRSLGPREFLGTASRLLTVRDLLRQITAGAASDPAVRLAALERQRAEIDEQIEAIRSGAAGGLDDTAIRERYAQAVVTARELLADLRQVEENFRALDRDVRVRATTWTGPRGEFLKTVFGSTAEIGASDQGRSWTAFWEHRLSARQQEELDELLAAVRDLPALDGSGGAVDQLLREELFLAADATQRTVASLSAQLRRFLDERSWTEGRRIHEVIRTTLAAALDVVQAGAREPGSDVPDPRADIALPLERPLYTPRTAAQLNSTVVTEDPADTADALADMLEVQTVDLTQLRAAVADTVTALGGHATLAQVVAAHPLTDGLAELVGYLQVAEEGATLLTERRERVVWIDAAGRGRQADIPLILFGDTATRLPAAPGPAPLPPPAPGDAPLSPFALSWSADEGSR
jgi:flagellar motility protein MotE (MotC chaperone)